MKIGLGATLLAVAASFSSANAGTPTQEASSSTQKVVTLSRETTTDFSARGRNHHSGYRRYNFQPLTYGPRYNDSYYRQDYYRPSYYDSFAHGSFGAGYRADGFGSGIGGHGLADHDFGGGFGHGGGLGGGFGHSGGFSHGGVISVGHFTGGVH